jgi:hypothetical protein
MLSASPTFKIERCKNMNSRNTRNIEYRRVKPNAAQNTNIPAVMRSPTLSAASFQNCK